MRRQPIDRIPFIGRMDLWYSYHQNGGTLPPPYENASLWDMQRDLGIGIFGFGAWDVSFYRLVHHQVEVTTKVEHGETTVQYHTPHGTLTCRERMTEDLREAAGAGARVEFPFKNHHDYDALQFLVEHTEVVENFDAYDAFVNAIGTDGLALPFAGWLPAHQLMIRFMGYERFYYELHDHPNRVEALIGALTEQYREILALAADCPAQAIEVGANYDEQMTPPRVFDRYFAPLYREARETLARDGKILVVHGDGEMRQLLERLMLCGVQVVEALTPKPMTSIDVAATRRLWGNRVVMWGGLASVILTETFSDEAFEQYLEDLFEAVAPGDGFVLGFGDNVPTDALFPRIQRVAEFWAERGGYPLPGREGFEARSMQAGINL
jgi:uroporphyrinogen-III decarboxylase